MMKDASDRWHSCPRLPPPPLLMLLLVIPVLLLSQ